jgi:hypothetical protein
VTSQPACQCAVHPDDPCDAAITQEDLHCDTCRQADGGCAVMFVNGVAMSVHCNPLTITYQIGGAYTL